MMQLHISGRLVRDPQSKTSAAGNPYLSAMAVVGAGDKEALVTLMVFDADLQTLLASLKKGDTLSAIGSASIRAYADKEGNPAAGVTVMVNRLMTMTAKEAAPRPRGDSPGNGPRPRRESPPAAGPREFAPLEFSDSIPF
jgi:single-stranded DNA-binding protein